MHKKKEQTNIYSLFFVKVPKSSQPLRGWGILLFRFPAFHAGLIKLIPSGLCVDKLF